MHVNYVAINIATGLISYKQLDVQRNTQPNTYINSRHKTAEHMSNRVCVLMNLPQNKFKIA